MHDLLQKGTSLTRAKGAVLMVHGRGASAASILSLADVFDVPGLAYLAPQASDGTWYPYSFLAPLHQNEPGITYGLETLLRVLSHIEESGIAGDRTVLLGFSQGACLASEFVARNPARYGGLVVLSGGLIGNVQLDGKQPPFDKGFEYSGSLEGTPVFLGCSDVDPHIPVERVLETSSVMKRLGGNVTERIYPGMGHVVNEEEIEYVRQLLVTIAAP